MIDAFLTQLENRIQRIERHLKLDDKTSSFVFNSEPQIQEEIKPIVKPLIGIGLITYNRGEAATEVAEAIINTLEHDKFDYKLVCSLDQEFLTTGYEKLPKGFILFPHENVGISVNKSVAMMHLQECDHVFLFEDDLKPVKRGWETLFLNMHKETGIGLFNYIQDNVCEADKSKTTKTFQSGELIYCNSHVAQIMSITSQTLKTVGALDPRYQGYGYEHCDYTRRCARAGLYPTSKFPFIKETWEYTELLKIPDTTSKAVRKKQMDYNSKIYSKQPERILIPFTEIEEFMKGKITYEN